MADHADIVSVTDAVEQDRAALITHLGELRLALRRRLDPREQIRAHPRAALIVALGAGLLLRILFSRRRARRQRWIR